jgi:hypothetical protein
VNPPFLLALALQAATPQPSPYAWQTLVPGESAQWGIPTSGARPSIRVECGPGGRLLLSGPAAMDAQPGVPIRVTFHSAAAHVTLLAVVVETPDGRNFSLPVQAGELPIATLLRGEALNVSVAEESWDIPGDGAPAILAPLISACGARSPSRN